MEDNKFLYLILITFLLTVCGIGTCNYFSRKVENTTNAAIVKYEEFQLIYNTCEKLNSDLCNMKSLNEKDVMFEQFSKQQRINTLKGQLDRWINEYNAKSNLITHSLWKSNNLPYQLQSTQYKCYND